jgi:kynureninase
MEFENSVAFAKKQDKNDPLKKFRKEFYIPKEKGEEVIYLCGNSLGLQPKCTEDFIHQELKDWRKHGVEGHFNAKNPWLSYHKQFEKPLMHLLGAKANEVVAMNQLTVNLNLLLLSFYQPKGKKIKIVLEANAFPSDYYAAEQIIKLRGFDPKKCLLELPLRKGESTHHIEDIAAFLEKNKGEVCLLLLGGVNYYSGQVFDMKKVGELCKKNNIVYGLDLAHAIGNVPLSLHAWGVDFATWCSYKYLNSGPGGVSGAFVHERHAKNKELDRFGGWWGNDEKTRFKMLKHFVPADGAQGWQLSNAPILSMAAHAASLSVYEKTSIHTLRAKSVLLSGYLRFLLDQIEHPLFLIITPKNENERGCQVSIQMKKDGKKVFELLSKNQIIADWREPDVIRIAPVPLYNSFEDVFTFVKQFASFL